MKNFLTVWSSRAVIGSALLAGLLAVSCTSERPAENPVVVDLVAFFEDAAIQLPTSEIDFGTPAARAHLVHGFHPMRRPLQANRFAMWSLAGEAEVEFFVDRPAPLELTFRCAPVPHEGEPLPTITLEVGGREIFSQQIEKGFREYKAQIPKPALSQGENRLTIRHPRVAADIRREGRDTRIIWDWLRLNQMTPPPPRVEAEEKTLFVPSGSRVDFYLDLPAGARLETERVVPRSHEGPLRIRWQPLEGPPIEQDLVRSERARVALTTDTPAAGRLSIGAPTTADAADGQGGVILVAPAIERTFGSEALAAPPTIAEATPPTEKPHIVVYMIDTLRADHLGAYGYHRNTSPNIDRFAETATLFENSQAQTSWTRASVASVLTGLWSQLHGALDDPDMLAQELVTLPERLQEAGYLTAGFVANGNAGNNFGFDQGFDHFEYLVKPSPDEELARGYHVNAAVYKFLDEHKDDPRPLFLWVHTIDPHAPYMAPEPFHSQFSDRPRNLDDGSIERLIKLHNGEQVITQEEIDHLIDLYDAEIAANDASFGDLVAQLTERGIYEKSVVAVLSDHGEEFFEHGGFQHGKTLHSDQLDTPLIVRVPGLPGLRRTETAEHVDLAPTLLELAGAEPLETTQGRSLVPLLSPGDVPWDNRSVAYLQLRGIKSASYIDASGDYKTIVNHHDGVEAFPKLYHRAEDRRETSDLAIEEETSRAHYLATRLRLQIAGAQQLYEGGSAELPEETLEQLRALGYIE